MSDIYWTLDTEKVYPVLTVRNAVLFPRVVMPVSASSVYSIQEIEDAVRHGEPLLVVTQKRDEPLKLQDTDGLYKMAVKANILRVVKSSDEQYSIYLQGNQRVSIGHFMIDGHRLRASGRGIEEVRVNLKDDGLLEVDALYRSLKGSVKQFIRTAGDFPKDVGNVLMSLEDPGQLCDVLAANLDFSVEEKMSILESVDIKERLEKSFTLLTKRLEVLRYSKKIQNQIQEEIDKSQKEYYLRQQLKVIQEQLGDGAGDSVGYEELRRKVEEGEFPDDVRAVCQKQLRHLSQMQPSSGEYGVTRTYLETLIEIPWCKTTEDNLSVSRAREILDEDHYDLDRVKKRIVEFLAVRQLKQDMKGPILCLYGPPGVGKTSLGKSVARALGRKFYRFSLGGMHDESEIRGHRRTYLGALPGRIVQALRRVGTMNPVIMLDEVDKIGKDFRGDPASALLEVLDPEQNNSFSDHYVEIPVDLSKVLFIATANQLETIAPALRDRMEIIEIPGYTFKDKEEIARQFLIPRSLENHGLQKEHFKITHPALKVVINNFTREAGVRGLEQRLAELCRAAAVLVAEARDKGKAEPCLKIGVKEVDNYLEGVRYEYEVAQRTAVPGVATGLAWTPHGGDILFIEVTSMLGKGALVITGKLGDVMQESVRAALSYIRSHSVSLGLDEEFSKDMDIHLHVPAGAIPKDGPSAGVTIFTALLSLFLGKRVRKDIAMTGEITLRGHILAVGGIKEKVLGAHRAGIRRLLIPKRNQRDLREVKAEILDEMEIVFVEHVNEVLDEVFEEKENVRKKVAGIKDKKEKE